MHFDAFDRYHETESFLHRLDPRIKVIVTVAFILSNALLPDGAWIAFAVSWLFLLFVNVLSNLGVIFTFKRSFVALPFAIVAVPAPAAGGPARHPRARGDGGPHRPDHRPRPHHRPGLRL